MGFPLSHWVPKCFNKIMTLRQYVNLYLACFECVAGLGCNNYNNIIVESLDSEIRSTQSR